MFSFQQRVLPKWCWSRSEALEREERLEEGLDPTLSTAASWNSCSSLAVSSKCWWPSSCSGSFFTDFPATEWGKKWRGNVFDTASTLLGCSFCIESRKDLKRLTQRVEHVQGHVWVILKAHKVQHWSTVHHGFICTLGHHKVSKHG